MTRVKYANHKGDRKSFPFFFTATDRLDSHGMRSKYLTSIQSVKNKSLTFNRHQDSFVFIAELGSADRDLFVSFP